MLVGNSLGCPIIVEVATTFPDRIQRAVLVSPAGGPNNQPLGRAIGQMAMDGLREPLSMLPIATRDYLRFGGTSKPVVVQGDDSLSNARTSSASCCSDTRDRRSA